MLLTSARFKIILLLCLLLTGCEAEYLPVFPKHLSHCAIRASVIQPISPADVLSPVHKPSIYECVHVQYGEVTEKVCGYDCKFAGGTVRCGNVPGEHCIIGSADYIACGFDCKKSTINGMANCGIRYGDRCFQAAEGNIVCGLNCHLDQGFILCENSPSFRYERPTIHNVGY